MKANDRRLLVQRHYYTDKNGNLRVTGVFVGFYDEVAEKVRTGFSRVNYSPRDGNNNLLPPDRFNMEVGIDLAIVEAILPSGQKIKDSEENQYFWDNYVAFIDRATRYFRQGLSDVPVNQRNIQYMQNVNDFFSMSPSRSSRSHFNAHGLVEAKALNKTMVIWKHRCFYYCWRNSCNDNLWYD